MQLGGLLTASGSASVFDALEDDRARVRLLRIFQLPVVVFWGNLQHVLHVFVKNADWRFSCKEGNRSHGRNKNHIVKPRYTGSNNNEIRQ